jgi:hypothetical protein
MRPSVLVEQGRSNLVMILGGDSERKTVARSTSTGASGANTPAHTHRESVVQSVREFDEGRGGVVLETVDASEE